MRHLIIFFLTVAACMAEDKHGTGTNPFGSKALDEIFSLSFFTKESDDSLYYRLSWKPGETSSSSVSSGSGVAPGGKFVYFWDDARKVFWFASGDVLQKHDLSKAMDGSTSGGSSNLASYQHEKDFPAEMIPMLQELINKQESR
jgi:hypothetical protein